MAEVTACFDGSDIQSGTLFTITSSLGCLLLLLDTWALVDATAEGYN
ncbi:hypothetical protein SLEP1_g43391 [Rubroshorea leprosula]|uniref:Uncharacterized protein n=1 Tax=Rubroshorea leprosula TaxID=152421 RepID=A0AAV5LDL7_9ROSI|nr:hypothetical protein SLEP1_g43391 [Rubroshorea leprosula]